MDDLISTTLDLIKCDELYLCLCWIK